jgi:soluble lytic murein transglycosylase-like protein
VLAIEARVAKIGGKGRIDPLGRSACAPAGKAAIAVQWREPVTSQRMGVGRAVALDLTRLESGRYVIAISVSGEGASAPPSCTSREIELAGR